MLGAVSSSKLAIVSVLSGVIGADNEITKKRTRAATISAQTGAPFLVRVHGLVEALCSSLASEAVSEADAPCFAVACDARGARVAVRERRSGVASATRCSKPASSQCSSRPGGLGGGEKERRRAERGGPPSPPAGQADHTACSEKPTLKTCASQCQISVESKF
jgi:hypothetical protein